MNEDLIRMFNRAQDIPEEWDVAAGDGLFLRRKSLLIMEEANSCGQLYHLAGKQNSISIAVTYRHRLNLLTYGKGLFSVPVTMIGVPCSIARRGYRFHDETTEEMLNHLCKIEGMKLILNTDNVTLPGFIAGKTLPTCRLDLRWKKFSDYLASMRSHYRYRFNKAQSRWKYITESVVDKRYFSDELYQLYVNVYKRSRYKLEKLNIDFFKKYPSEITVFRLKDKPIAFVQTIQNKDELIFMFVGMDYSVSKKYDTYLNSLLYIIRKGIDSGVNTIDFGQTTENIKCQLGSRLVPKGILAAHSGRLRHLALSVFGRVLDYKYQECDYNVFK